MKTRILTAIPLIAVVVVVLYFRGVVLAATIAAISCVAVFEMAKALKEKQLNPLVWVCYIYAVACAVFTYFFGLTYALPLLMGFVVIAMSVSLLDSKFQVPDALATVGILVYPVTFLSILLALGLKEKGLFYIVMAIGSSVICDTFAYFTGMLFGKRKLCPEISPHKTIAGAVGGTVMTMILLPFVTLLFGGNFHLSNMLTWLCIGFICAIFAQFGDLFASFIKRWCGIKDYGKIFPGHGGVMDRVDSIMFTSVIIYIFVAVGVI